MNTSEITTVDPAPPVGDPAPPSGGEKRVKHKKRRERQERARAKRPSQQFWRDIFAAGGLGMMEFKDRHPELQEA